MSIVLAGCIVPTDYPGHHESMGDHHGANNANNADSGNLAFTGAEARVVNITAGAPDELRFQPDWISVRAGQRIGIVFSNLGDAEHEFSINEVSFHLHAGSGETKRAAFVAPGPGEYTIGCYVPGHFEAGMAGTLEVLA